MAAAPNDLLEVAFLRASRNLGTPLVADIEIAARIETICRYARNRACARFILACTLAKTHRPEIDIRKPYTEIPDADSYSGRTYDEAYIGAFVVTHRLPCNPTTAFLTPAFRNRNITLTPETVMVGRPEWLYKATLLLLDDVQMARMAADVVLSETIRQLVIIRDERQAQLESLLVSLKATGHEITLSSEEVVNLIAQHLQTAYSSRLPVLIVAAAYKAVAERLGEQLSPLERHNAADEQTGTLGDIEITLANEQAVVTSYEMKARKVTRADIDQALHKIRATGGQLDNYIFVTTEPIDVAVRDYAASLYERTNGVEIVILDCLSFLRHFLHFFHRWRAVFLDYYQQLVLNEPDSAVDQPLKVAFLALRQAAESRSVEDE